MNSYFSPILVQAHGIIGSFLLKNYFIFVSLRKYFVYATDPGYGRVENIFYLSYNILLHNKIQDFRKMNLFMGFLHKIPAKEPEN